MASADLPTQQSFEDLELKALMVKHNPTSIQDYLDLKTPTSTCQVTRFKYLPVWRRAVFRIKVRKVLSFLGDDIIKFGTSSDFLDYNNNFKANVEEILWKKQNKKEDFRLLTHCTEHKLPWNLIYPDSAFMKAWSLVLSIILLYTAAVMPIRLAFYDVVFFDAWTILDLCIDSLFAVDIVVNCTVSYERRDGNLETSSRAVFSSYARTWMAFDVLACMPFSFIEYGQNTQEYGNSGADQYNDLIRLLRVPRLYKLLRILRIAKAFKHYKSNTFIAQVQDYLRINSRKS
jgi:hypothetical protein